MYRANKGSLKTAESGEIELRGERAREVWKLPNPKRPICVPGKYRGTWKQQDLGRQFVYRGWGGKERACVYEKPKNS